MHKIDFILRKKNIEKASKQLHFEKKYRRAIIRNREAKSVKIFVKNVLQKKGKRDEQYWTRKCQRKSSIDWQSAELITKRRNETSTGKEREKQREERRQLSRQEMAKQRESRLAKRRAAYKRRVETTTGVKQ